MKLFNKKAQSGMQIFILIVATFSFAYLISDTKLVSADSGAGFTCCEKLDSGAACQEVIDSGECDNNFAVSPSRCDSTSFCKLGCCIDRQAGTYDKNVPQGLCGGEWVADKNCNLNEAIPGCCVLGQTTAYVTDAKCVNLASQFGVEKNFIPEATEPECVAMSEFNENEGACVQGTLCKLESEQECQNSTGTFNKGYLCTSKELNTTCEKTKETGCFGNKDEVYFVDSCGNRANIYDASKVDDDVYWEKIISKKDSCGAGLGNGNSADCGNCNRFLGGRCSEIGTFKPTLGNNYCRSTSCKWGESEYKNGESWCEYEWAVGNGNDLPGSRYWRYVCNQGDVQADPCADYRNEVCVQASVDMGEAGTFSNAICRINNWRECLTYNTEGAEMEKCSEAMDCFNKSIIIDDYFYFDVCLPEYPPGFGYAEEERSVAEELCGMASQKCTIVYEKKLFSGWECIANCYCDAPGFADTMNDFCRSIGDCGLEPNVAGKLSEGSYKVTTFDITPQKIESLIALASAGAEQSPPSMDEPAMQKYMESAGLLGTASTGGSPPEPGNPSITALKLGAGAFGVGYASVYIANGALVGFAGMKTIFAASAEAWAKTPMLAQFANGAMAIGAALIVTSLINMVLGIQGDAALVGSLTSVASFLTLYYTNLLGKGWTLGPALTLAVLIGVLVGWILSLLGIGDTKQKVVEFKCLPWNPPAGGADCALCNEGIFHTCTEYRCKTFGSACEIANKGTEEELCYTGGSNDLNPPTIEPLVGTITEGLKYSDISSTGFSITKLDGSCIDAYTNVYFGLKTNKPAKCKYDTEAKSFEEMQYDFRGGSLYLFNQTANYFLMDPTHGQFLGFDFKGETTLYIKCEDPKGNQNTYPYSIEMCVNPGPDLLPPIIKSTSPANYGLVGYNVTSVDAAFYNNEPAECKWSYEDKSYDDMENAMTCETNIQSNYNEGYRCSSTLSLEGNNTYYVRCKDQPWLLESSERNVNSESYEYVIQKVENPLIITNVTPAGTISLGTFPATVNLKAETKDGGNIHECEYSFSGNWITFFKTFSKVHEQELNLDPGEYNINVRCHDETGYSTEESTSFTIEIDSSGPEINRLYKSGGSLKLITNEESECKYSLDGCGFDYTNASSMGKGKEHSAPITIGKTYYITCKDSFGNGPGAGDCSVIVKLTET